MHEDFVYFHNVGKCFIIHVRHMICFSCFSFRKEGCDLFIYVVYSKSKFKRNSFIKVHEKIFLFCVYNSSYFNFTGGFGIFCLHILMINKTFKIFLDILLRILWKSLNSNVQYALYDKLVRNRGSYLNQQQVLTASLSITYSRFYFCLFSWNFYAF